MKALKYKHSAQHDSVVSTVLSLCGGHANSLHVVTVDKGRVLLIVGYYYLVYSILSNRPAFSGRVPIFGSIHTAVLLSFDLFRFLYRSLCIFYILNFLKNVPILDKNHRFGLAFGVGRCGLDSQTRT